MSYFDSDPLLKEYSKEWGIPTHDDRKLFEILSLEIFQAGLNWKTILKKRDEFRVAFDNFDVAKVATFDENKFSELINNKGIIRNRLKIKATINNAQIIQKMHQNNQTFDNYIWSFTNFKVINNHRKPESELPAETELSAIIAKDMKKVGFKFIGSTTVYSFLQSSGIVNDTIN